MIEAAAAGAGEQHICTLIKRWHLDDTSARSYANGCGYKLTKEQEGFSVRVVFKGGIIICAGSTAFNALKNLHIEIAKTKLKEVSLWERRKLKRKTQSQTEKI